MGNRKFLETYARFYREIYGWSRRQKVRCNTTDPRQLTIPGKLTTKVEIFNQVREYDEKGKCIFQGPEFNKEIWLIGNIQDRDKNYRSFFIVANEVAGDASRIPPVFVGTISKMEFDRVVSPSEITYDKNPLRHRISFLTYDSQSIDEETNIADIKDLKVIPSRAREVELYEVNYDMPSRHNIDLRKKSGETYYIGNFKDIKDVCRERGQSIIGLRPEILGCCYYGDKFEQGHCIIDSQAQRRHIIPRFRFKEVDFDLFKNRSENQEQE